MGLLDEFDANTVDPTMGPPLVSAGEHIAEIVESADKETKDGKGEYLALTWQITDGPEARKKIFVNLNLKNENPQTVAIAQAEVSAICRACGKPRPNGSGDLHQIRCRITVKHKRGKDGETRAQIVKYEPYRSALGSEAHMPPGAATAGNPPLPTTPPWRPKA